MNIRGRAALLLCGLVLVALFTSGEGQGYGRRRGGRRRGGGRGGHSHDHGGGGVDLGNVFLIFIDHLK